MGQTPGSPSPTYRGPRSQAFQRSPQVQKEQNIEARATQDPQPQYEAQEPYHPPYERQTLVQQVRQQQYQQPQQLQPPSPPPQQQQGYQGYSQFVEERVTHQVYSNPGNQHPGQPLYQETFQQTYQQPFQQYQQGGGQYQQYGQQAHQPYHGQPQPVQQNPPPTDSYSNPRTVFFHMLFKGSAVFLYIFGGWITSSFVLLFVVIVLLVAFDFWTVKNVSGRILVGLRYWNESDQNGKSIWRFESLDRQSLDRLNKNDTMLFWTSLYVTPAIWALFSVVALLKFNFDFLMIDLIALTMCASNIIGFTKCHKESKKKVVQSFARQAMGGFMREAMTSGLASNLSKVLNVF